jgi:hypothetical protein
LRGSVKRPDFRERSSLRSQQVPHIFSGVVCSHVGTCLFDDHIGASLGIDCPVDAALVDMADRFSYQEAYSQAAKK